MNKRDKEFMSLLVKAQSAGLEAAKAKKPMGMLVTETANPLDPNSEVIMQEYISDGVCGFAWVNVKPGNCPFANFLKKQGEARPDEYYGGVTVWVSDFNQSMERKEAYAGAYAKVLREAGLKAYMSSRMD